MGKPGWQRLNRKQVYNSKFLKVYEDTVRLPNGQALADYTVVEKPSVVIVVATTASNDVLVLREYKYAANKELLTLPAGHLKTGEKPTDAAKRELLEETGFTADTFDELGVLYDYPTKDLHVVHVVRARRVSKVAAEQPEATETIRHEIVSLNELKAQIKGVEWQASSALAALARAGILF